MRWIQSIVTWVRRASRFAREYAQDEGWARLARTLPRKAAALRPRRVPRHDPLPARQPSRPISFVVVRVTDQVDHNALASECVHDPLNQRIVVDRLEYDTFAHAVNAALERAVHDVVCLVREDTYLPRGWQARLEDCLAKLEARDRAWAVAGPAGWDEAGKPAGHVSTPARCLQTFRDGWHFLPAAALDDALIIFRHTNRLALDPRLPGDRGHGRDLVATARSRDRSSYILDSPVVVGPRDGAGRPIRRALDAPRAQDAFYSRHRAEMAAAREYLERKGSIARPPSKPDRRAVLDRRLSRLAKWQHDILDAPTILLARGGGGSRLLALLARDCGLFIGNRLNTSGDCLELARPVYRALFRKFCCGDAGAPAVTPLDLRASAARMLRARGWRRGRAWGLKVPECLLLVPELCQAFPRARFVFLHRHPLATCLRRPHQTAQPDNPIGRLVLPLAYRQAGVGLAQLAVDSPAERMAYSTRHQWETVVRDRMAHAAADRWCDLWFEELLRAPAAEAARLAAWLGLPGGGRRLRGAIDLDRGANRGSPRWPAPTVLRVKAVLEPLYARLPYDPDWDGLDLGAARRPTYRRSCCDSARASA